MYVAALRIADDFGLDAVGIQYQQGLKDTRPRERPRRGTAQQRAAPAGDSAGTARASSTPAHALPHFNEVDEGVAVDALVTNRIWTAMGLDPATTLHDVRWGEEYDGQFVWVFEISGSVPGLAPDGGYADAEGMAAAADVLPARGRHPQRGVASLGRSSGRACS